MRTNLILFMTALIFASGCEKDNNSQIQSDKIQLGSIADLLINAYDTVLISDYNDFKSIELDIDRDNSADYAIISEYWGSPLLGQRQQSRFLSINSNNQIAGYINVDTIYISLKADTLIGEGSVYIYNTTTYSCSRMDENDSIQEVVPNQFKILPKWEKEYLSKTDLFSSDTLILCEEAYTVHNSSVYQNDTSYSYLTRYNNYCGNFQPDVIQFIGIKIGGLKSEKLGWIKLSIRENYKITILESAIQK